MAECNHKIVMTNALVWSMNWGKSFHINYNCCTSKIYKLTQAFNNYSTRTTLLWRPLCYDDPPVTTSTMFRQPSCYDDHYVTETTMLWRPLCYTNLPVTATTRLQPPPYYNNYPVTTTTLLWRLLCYNDHYVTKTTMLRRPLCCDAAKVWHSKQLTEKWPYVAKYPYPHKCLLLCNFMPAVRHNWQPR